MQVGNPLTALSSFANMSSGPLLHHLSMIHTHSRRSLAYLAGVSPLLILLLGPLAQQSVTLKLRQADTAEAESSMPTVTNYTAQKFLDSFTTL